MRNGVNIYSMEDVYSTISENNIGVRKINFE